MDFDNTIIEECNKLLHLIQANPKLPTVDHGECVSILLWWMFIVQHAKCHELEPAALAREQLEAFIETMAPIVEFKVVQ